ncbi:MAG: redoxin family protein [Planctomycetes bacterium]|nr:redoxin family protein [Planctomycetota bacterium]
MTFTKSSWFLALAVLCGPVAAQAEVPVVIDRLGKKIDATFTDLNGKPAPLSAFKDKKAIVVVFLSFDCPVSNSYAVTLTEMNKQYGDKGAAFVAVSTSDDPAEVRKQASEFKIPFSVYIDPKLDGTDALKATTTPEAFVLDHNFMLRYRGRIDNTWQARLKKHSETTEFDLKNAIEDVLAGRDVRIPATRPVGCPVIAKGAIARPTTTSVTYYKDVLPILQNNCQGCHRPGAVGPFSLMNFKQAVNWAEDIKSYTQDRRMPPWKPSEGLAFHNDRRLSEEQIKLLAAWVDGGTPEGNVKDAEPAKEFSDGWQLGKPDLIVTVQDDFILGASGRDMFRCFVLPTNLTEDKYIVGFEVKPGNQRVVHHTLNFWDTSGTARKMEQEAKEKAKETDPDRGPGYSASMGVGFRAAPGKMGGFGGWAPGQMPRFLPKGTGYFLPKGADLVIQTHYHRDGKEEKDRMQIGLYFAKEPIERPYQALVVNGFGLFQFIPAGKNDYKTKGTAIVSADCTVYSVMPHMHLLGKSVKVTMTPPGSDPFTLVKIDDWDYNWQETYWFKDPLKVKAGTKIEIEAIYDNSDKNPNNPKHPPGSVFVGEQTTNEMLFGFLGATSDVKGTRVFARPAPLIEKK